MPGDQHPRPACATRRSAVELPDVYDESPLVSSALKAPAPRAKMTRGSFDRWLPTRAQSFVPGPSERLYHQLIWAGVAQPHYPFGVGCDRSDALSVAGR